MNKKSLRKGFTTGACAAAAAKAAAVAYVTGELPGEIDIPMPAGGRVRFSLLKVEKVGDKARASVIKDAGDDPDITNGMEIIAEVSQGTKEGLSFEAGEGVGLVTRKGLSMPPGEPAINPGPRKMMNDAVREVTDLPIKLTLSIPGGERVAQNTFNPRLGIMGGLSVLGTTGIVRPYSHEAITASLVCSLDVAIATGSEIIALTAGNIGTSAAKGIGINEEIIVEVGNEWGFMLDMAKEKGIKKIVIAGHPGKLAKLAAGEFDTHSSRSKSAIPFVNETLNKYSGLSFENANTVEEIIESLSGDMKKKGASHLAALIANAVSEKCGADVTVHLVNMAGEITGSSGLYNA